MSMSDLQKQSGVPVPHSSPSPPAYHVEGQLKQTLNARERLGPACVGVAVTMAVIWFVLRALWSPGLPGPFACP